MFIFSVVNHMHILHDSSLFFPLYPLTFDIQYVYVKRRLLKFPTQFCIGIFLHAVKEHVECFIILY